MARLVGEFAARGLVNIVGGCCGTTPDHIARDRRGRRAAQAAHRAGDRPRLRLSGLEPFILTDAIPFVNVGERTNVTGSAHFRKLITDGDYAAALEVARDQVENGAQIIDVNMDEGLLDSEAAMVTFLNLIAAEPDIARVPVMIDSSKWAVIEAGLKCVQGKPIVNSISMKEGEEKFLHEAKIARRHGAAVVVMAFDEVGQADTVERKIEICKRAYDILVDRVGFPPEDIIFDPNIFAIATGIEEHNNYGVDFIEATRWIRKNLPDAHISGGVSNLSFSFRGNEPVREAMHSVFLYHAIEAGMDMGIVNAGQLAVYDDIDPELREVVRGRRPQPRSRRDRAPAGARGKVPRRQDPDQGSRSRLARVAGGEAALARAGARHHRVHRGGHRGGAQQLDAPARRDRGPADGRHERGRRPLRRRQDVPAAGREVRARDEAGGGLPDAVHGGGEGAQRRTARDRRQLVAGKIVIATVKGDVHDIGKNIVGVVLQCNNYEVIDLGVMVPAAKILETAKAEKADIVGLSGLITPSLDEMAFCRRRDEREASKLPLLIGGATTSRVHTAVKIDPSYRAGPVVHVADASRAVGVASVAAVAEKREAYAADVRAEYAKIRDAHRRAQADKQRADARRRRAPTACRSTSPRTSR